MRSAVILHGQREEMAATREKKEKDVLLLLSACMQLDGEFMKGNYL